MLTAEGKEALRYNHKLSGQHMELDGFWCFVGEAKGRQVIYDMVPIEQHKKELEAARVSLEDLKRIHRGELTVSEYVKRHCK